MIDSAADGAVSSPAAETRHNGMRFYNWTISRKHMTFSHCLENLMFSHHKSKRRAWKAHKDIIFKVLPHQFHWFCKQVYSELYAAICFKQVRRTGQDRRQEQQQTENYEMLQKHLLGTLHRWTGSLARGESIMIGCKRLILERLSCSQPQSQSQSAFNQENSSLLFYLLLYWQISCGRYSIFNFKVNNGPYRWCADDIVHSYWKTQ